MSRIIIVLINTINTEIEGSVNYRIARYILEHIDDLEVCNISTIASNCYVGNASVSRFVRKIGFEDFFDLREEFIKMYNMDKKKFVVSNGSVWNYKEGYINTVIDNMNLIKESINYDKVEETIKDIFKFKKVCALGYLHSQYVALGLQNDLYTSKKLIDTRINFHEQLKYLENAQEDTFVIIFSMSGSYLDRFKYVNKDLFKKRKPKICIVTGNPNIEEDEIIDIVINFNVDLNYSSHPYALQLVANMISLGYYNYKIKS